MKMLRKDFGFVLLFVLVIAAALFAGLLES